MWWYTRSIAGEEGGIKSKVVFSGLGIAALYKFVADGLKLFPSEVDFSMKGSYTCGLGLDVLPALSGVGYICGIKISSYMFAGGVLSYLALIPAIAYFGGDAASKVVDDAGKAIAFNQLAPGQIWSNYIRYIGAGAVAAGGLISLIKSLPTMVKTFSHAVKGFGKKGEAGDRTQRDIPMSAAISIGTVICIVAAMAGDTSQDLKTGYIVGATPAKQQIGELIGAVVSAIAIGGVMYLLNAAWGFGSEQIPAPQATLMKMVVEGVMGGTLPWVLIFMGVFIAIVVEILGIPVLAFSMTKKEKIQLTQVYYMQQV